MILVTGGTGLVGAHLLYHLLQQHDRVRATHRVSSKLELVKEVFAFYTKEVEEHFTRIDWVKANITDIPALTEAFQGISQVYHCAAFISFNPKHYKALKKTNIEGTANVVNLCLSQGVQKLCYVSSVATLGDPLPGEFITEDTHWNSEAKNSVYSITKYGAEMEVWRGTQEGLDAVIVNPGVILGEGYWHSGSGVLVKRAAKGVKYYTDGSTGFVDVRDVVEMMILLMESDITNERYVLVAENLNYQSLLTQFAQAFGNRLPRRKVSKPSLLLASGLDFLSGTLFGTKRKLLKATVHSLFTHSTYDATKAKEILPQGLRSMPETIQRVAKAYLS